MSNCQDCGWGRHRASMRSAGKAVTVFEDRRDGRRPFASHVEVAAHSSDLASNARIRSSLPASVKPDTTTVTSSPRPRPHHVHNPLSLGRSYPQPLTLPNRLRSVDSGIIECMFEKLAAVDPTCAESTLVELIAELERVKCAAAAGQARAAAALDASRRATEAAEGIPAARRGRGVASEIALARLDSPARGNRHLGFAKALVNEMPYTLAALEAGVLTEWRATLIVRESACLEVEDRQTLDAEMCADPDRLNGMGDARLAAAAKTIAYRLNPHAVVDRAARAETERTVSIRPAPDTMTYLTALLPVAQGVSVYAALRREADICVDGRSRGQVMADTLVERVTGRSAATATPIAVNLVLSDETLMGGSSAPADVSGYGPIPAAVARGLISRAVGDERSRATLRRLYAHPTSGALMTMESRARLFPRGLATFIEFRDQRCRTPYCDAPIRHRDHARPWVAGGATSADNGLGLCERCNYVKETAGWFVESNVDKKSTHTAEFTTPTGAQYRSGAPPLPGSTARMEISEMEIAVKVTCARLHAA